VDGNGNRSLRDSEAAAAGERVSYLLQNLGERRRPFARFADEDEAQRAVLMLRSLGHRVELLVVGGA
jgi:hypothetical protein